MGFESEFSSAFWKWITVIQGLFILYLIFRVNELEKLVNKTQREYYLDWTTEAEEETKKKIQELEERNYQVADEISAMGTDGWDHLKSEAVRALETLGIEKSRAIVAVNLVIEKYYSSWGLEEISLKALVKRALKETRL